MPFPKKRLFSAAGFSLIEIIVIVTIIGLLTAIAIPAYKKLQERSVNTLVFNEMRVASGALQYFVFEKGYWPPDGAGGWPPELLGYLPPPDRWHQPTPIGGTWAWSLNSDNTAASLRINNYTAPASQIAKIDELMDDGGIATGSLLTSGQTLIYVLEK
jgi:type II secretory pathway pseudopilin PulG